MSDYFSKNFSLLNPEQKAAVEHEGKSLLILAGAGSGKTRVITTKIAYLIAKKNYEPHSILAVTFTKKAANEMRERAQKMEVRSAQCQIRTFHSFGAFFLRRYAQEAGVEKNFTVYDEADSATLVQKSFSGLKKNEAAFYAKKIALAKDFCIPCDSTRLSEISSDPIFPEVYFAYQKKLRATGNVDFGDLIMLPLLLLNSNENVARQMRYKFRVIMVDEYQDSNVAQFLLLKALSGVDEGSGTYVCVVGDDDQSIYKFRGAEVKNILDFQKQFPGTDLIRLERNYRSTKNILDVAQKVVLKNEGRLGKTLVSERGGGKSPDLIFLPTQDDEAEFCAELISKNFKKGVPYNSWAILYRTNAQSLAFESEFLRRKIPYQVVGSLKFYEREEIKDLLACLSLCANQKDEIAFRRIVNKPARGIGEKAQEKIIFAASDFEGSRHLESAGSQLRTEFRSEETLKQVQGDIQVQGDALETQNNFKGNLILAAQKISQTFSKKAKDAIQNFAELFFHLKNEIEEGKPGERLSSFVEEIIEKSGLAQLHGADDEISGTSRVANMQELANNAALYPFSVAGLLDFLDTIELDRSLASGADSAPDSVTLITLHNTKGLEFSRVIITGLEQGVFPRGDKTGLELEEERRLFYVGITRAKDELYVTSCAQRRLYGRTEFMDASVFLLEAGEGVFRVLGNAPQNYERGLCQGEGGEGENEILQKWAKGTKIYSDDFGYGVVSDCRLNGKECVIKVKYETGAEKTYLPKYQGAKIEVVRE